MSEKTRTGGSSCKHGGRWRQTGAGDMVLSYKDHAYWSATEPARRLLHCIAYCICISILKGRVLGSWCRLPQNIKLKPWSISLLIHLIPPSPLDYTVLSLACLRPCLSAHVSLCSCWQLAASPLMHVASLKSAHGLSHLSHLAHACQTLLAYCK